jgi:hypothetical protein
MIMDRATDGISSITSVRVCLYESTSVMFVYALITLVWCWRCCHGLLVCLSWSGAGATRLGMLTGAAVVLSRAPSD